MSQASLDDIHEKTSAQADSRLRWYILPRYPALHAQAIRRLEQGWRYEAGQITAPAEIGGSYLADGLPNVPPWEI